MSLLKGWQTLDFGTLPVGAVFATEPFGDFYEKIAEVPLRDVLPGHSSDWRVNCRTYPWRGEEGHARFDDYRYLPDGRRVVQETDLYDVTYRIRARLGGLSRQRFLHLPSQTPPPREVILRAIMEVRRLAGPPQEETIEQIVCTPCACHEDDEDDDEGDRE